MVGPVPGLDPVAQRLGSHSPATGAGARSREGAEANHGAKRSYPTISTEETFPESGSIPDDRILKSAEFRFLVYKEYLIFYQYDKKENAVYLLAFFNAKRDYTRVMRRFVRK